MTTHAHRFPIVQPSPFRFALRLLVLVSAGIAASCGDTMVCSRCEDSGFRIDSPSRSVRELTLGGSACQNAVVRSGGAPAGSDASTWTVDGFFPNAANYDVVPQNEGDCSIHVVFDDGAQLDRTWTIVRHEPGECCPEVRFYPSSWDGLPWELPSHTAPQDGGAD
jgi:hypothetical protein